MELAGFTAMCPYNCVLDPRHGKCYLVFESRRLWISATGCINYVVGGCRIQGPRYHAFRLTGVFLQSDRRRSFVSSEGRGSSLIYYFSRIDLIKFILILSTLEIIPCALVIICASRISEYV